MMTSGSKHRPFTLVPVLLLAIHLVSPAPTHTNSSSTTVVPRPSTPRPTTQPSWHLLLALWRPKSTTHPPSSTTAGSTLPLLDTPTHHQGSRPIVMGFISPTDLQADEPTPDDTGARPPRVIQEDPVKQKNSTSSQEANHHPLTTRSTQQVSEESLTIDNSGPGKWMNLNVATGKFREEIIFTSQPPSSLTPLPGFETLHREQNEDLGNIRASNTSLVEHESDEDDEVASHPAMMGEKILKHESSSDKKQIDVDADADDLDLPESPELDDHFFVHPLPHHRDVMEEGQQQTSLSPTTQPQTTTTTEHITASNTPRPSSLGPTTEPHNTTEPHHTTTEPNITTSIPPESHNPGTPEQQTGHTQLAASEASGSMNESLVESIDTPGTHNQTQNDKIPDANTKGQKVLEFQGPVVMEPLDEPSLVPLVGGSKEILTMKDDESAVLALLRVVPDSSHLESQFQGDTLIQELGVIPDHGAIPENSANPEQSLAATIIDSQRGVTSSPDDEPGLQRSSGARLLPPSLLVKKGSKTQERKSVNALDRTDKDEEVQATSEVPGIPTTTTPIYEEISGTLKVDTSIDDVEDFDAHSHHTENTDEFLPPTNTSHTNLIDVSLHFPNGSLRLPNGPSVSPSPASPSPTAKSPLTSTPLPFSDYPSHYPPKLSPSSTPQDPVTTTIDGETWSSFIGNITNLANVSLALNESILQRTLKLSMEEHNKMVLQERGSLMLQLMDPSTDPCDDFYQFACGKWNGKFPIRQDKAVDNTFERLKEDLDDVLRSLLEEPPSDDDNNITKSVKTLYSGCMNTDAIEALGAQPLLDLLNELGGWPVLEGDEWNDTGYDWVQQMAKLRNYNNDILISEWVAADITNSSNHIIQLDQPELGLPGREYFINPGDYQYREAYLNLMVRVTQLLGAPLSSALTEMSDVLHFEKQVSRILTAAEERRNLSAVHRRMTIEELNDEVPEIDWRKYLEMIAWENNQTEEVVVFGLDYFKKLVPLLSDTDNRTVSNYLLWRFVKNRISNLGQRYITEKQDYIKVLFGRKSQPERWRSCVTYVSGNLGYVVGAMFVKRYFPEASKNDTDEMIGLIRESFRTALDRALWMHEDTRTVAQQKVDTIVKNVGYPEYLLNDTYMDEVYKELAFNPETHFENVLKMLQFHARTNHNQLSVPVNRTAWVTSPAVVNAYYSRSKNMIVFPAGILQPPFYHPAFPRSLNYGGIGVVIGHEITHGFDDRGRQFDKNGNLQQWWKPEDVSKFYQRASCMLDQYGEYKVEEVGLKINPVNTLGENIADNAGIKISYEAYKTWRKSHDEDVSVPYVNLTHDQLFFLNFGQIWCEVNSPEAMLTKLRSGQHSPNKFRVIGTLSNSEEFSEAFNCPVGSRMNPERKCRVW